MQPDTSHRGGHSHLINSMRSYLHSQNRVQPIIGLGSVIELCTDAKPPVYLCEVCALKISKADIKTHIMGSLHRYNYIISRRVYGLKADADLTSLAWHLMELAKLVEKKEGTGNVQVLHLDEVIFREMMSLSLSDVLARVKEIKKQKHNSDRESSTSNKVSKCTYSTAAKRFTAAFSPACPSSSKTSALTLKNDPSLTRSSTLRASSSRTTPRPPKRWSPIRAPEQNNSTEADKPEEGSNDTGRCIGPESHQTDTAQAIKRMRVAQCQNTSLTVTINQKTNQDHISCQESSQPIGSQEVLDTTYWTPAILQDQYQLQDDFSIQKPLRNTDWRPHSSNELSKQSPLGYTGPLIGLQAVIKCESVDGDPPHCCYLCQACSLKLFESDLLHHLTNPQHQFNYINFQHPHLLIGMGRSQGLHAIVMQLEQEEGRGEMKVARLPASCLSEVLERDYYWCIQMLNCGFTEEIKPTPGPLMKGCSITLTKSNESTGNTLNRSDNGFLDDPVGEVSLSQWKKKKKNNKGVILKKAECKEPVFKVSLSLKAGTVVVDRMSLITTTVAPEIECQSPEPIYKDTESHSEDYITAGNRTLTPENTCTEQNPETIHTELYPSKHQQENTQSLGYTDAETSAYEYVNNSQFPDTGPLLSGSLNRSCRPNSFVQESPGSSTYCDWPTVELSPASSETKWMLERQPVRNSACDQLMETDPVTQHSNNWPKNELMFVQPKGTQVMFVNQAHQQMMRARNYEVMNVPMYAYPAATGAYVPCSSNPARYADQSWMWGGTTLPYFSNQYNYKI